MEGDREVLEGDGEDEEVEEVEENVMTKTEIIQLMYLTLNPTNP